MSHKLCIYIISKTFTHFFISSALFKSLFFTSVSPCPFFQTAVETASHFDDFTGMCVLYENNASVMRHGTRCVCVYIVSAPSARVSSQ